MKDRHELAHHQVRGTEGISDASYNRLTTGTSDPRGERTGTVSCGSLGTPCPFRLSYSAEARSWFSSQVSLRVLRHYYSCCYSPNIHGICLVL